jgi:hypothetical protein
MIGLFLWTPTSYDDDVGASETSPTTSTKLEFLKMSKFDSDPRDYALEMVENGLVSSDHLLICALKYMSHDDVRDMLDCNELSPRFTDDEEEDNELEN